MPPDATNREELESVFRRMVEALAERDTDALGSLLSVDVELRSNAIGGELAVGRPAALAAVEANGHLLFDPVLLSFHHLGAGWMIVPSRLRHSMPLGGIADSTKTVLAQVIGAEVRVSLVFRDLEEARAEYDRRTASPRDLEPG